MEGASKLVRDWLDSFSAEEADLDENYATCHLNPELVNALIVFLENPEYYDEVSNLSLFHGTSSSVSC